MHAPAGRSTKQELGSIRARPATAYVNTRALPERPRLSNLKEEDNIVRSRFTFGQFGVQRKSTLVFWLALYALGLSLAAHARDHAATIVTFDVPAAGIGTFQGTLASA